MQREEPGAVGGRTHSKRHQADVWVGHRRWTERQLYGVQLTPDGDWAVSLLRRLLPCRANWRYRPRPCENQVFARSRSSAESTFQIGPGSTIDIAGGGR